MPHATPWSRLAAGWVATALLGLAGPAAWAQSSPRGQAIYDAKCAGCHSVDAHRVGPLHRGVLGRRAGSVQGYDYSEALRKSRIVWSRETLRAWLTDPEALIPGQAMNYSLSDAAEREEVVNYLSTLKKTP